MLHGEENVQPDLESNLHPRTTTFVERNRKSMGAFFFFSWSVSEIKKKMKTIIKDIWNGIPEKHIRCQIKKYIR
jgi:hypothetical protein